MAKTHRPINVKASPYRASGNGTVDDTRAISAAVSAAARGRQSVYFPDGVYKITDTVTIPPGIPSLFGTGVLRMALSPAATPSKLFDLHASDLVIDGLTFDGSGSDREAAGGNKYVIYAEGNASARLSNITVKNCCFRNILYTDNNPPLTNLLVAHAVYFTYVDHPVLSLNRLTDISGAAFFLSYTTDSKIVDNVINNTGWYSIQLQSGNAVGLISGNTITGAGAPKRMWGGSINLMSDGSRNVGPFQIVNNYISGYHNYGAVIDIQSVDGVIVSGNVIEAITSSDMVSFIRVESRGVGAYQGGSCSDISVTGNILRASETGNQSGIYVDNYSHGISGLGYGSRFIVALNVLISADVDHCFAAGVWFHGQDWGLADIVVANNVVSGRGSRILGGLVGFTSSDKVPMYGVQVSGNNLSLVGVADDPGSQTGVFIGSHVDRVSIGQNSVRGFYYGIRGYTDSGPNLYGLPTNAFQGSASVNLLLSVVPPLNTGFPESGSTGARPVAVWAGRPFYDTTISEMLWWNGANWIDSNGSSR